MRTDDEHDEPMTREEVLAKYGWQPGEKEQADAELAERARIDRERMLNEAREAAARAAGPRLADGETTYERRAKAEADGRYWRNYISEQIASNVRGLNRAIATVVVAEERSRARADAEVMQVMSMCGIDSTRWTRSSTSSRLNSKPSRISWPHRSRQAEP